jgi:hypothetical protein
MVMLDKSAKTASMCLYRADRAVAMKANWDELYQRVSDLVRPDRQFNVTRARGEQRRTKIYNGTARDAGISLSAAIEGLLSNGALPWMSLVDTDEESMTDEDRSWYFHATTVTLNYLGSARSGWASASHECYYDLATYGTGVLLPRMVKGWLHWEAKDLGDYYLIENDAGIVDEAHRRLRLTARELVSRYGQDAVSEETRKRAEDPKQETEEVDLWHCVFPNTNAVKGKLGAKGKRYLSIMVEEKAKHVLSIKGFDEFPYLTPRWMRQSGETYGVGPSIIVLPTIETLNAITLTNLMAGQLATMPPLTVPDGSVKGPLSTAPGSLIYIDEAMARAKLRPEPLFSGARPDIGKMFEETYERRIEQAHFLDVIRLPDRDRMTATEVIERRQQGLLAASPVLSRLYAELLNPVVQRTVKFLLRKGLIRPRTESMRRRRAKIEYQGPLAISQKAARNNAVLSALSAAAPVIDRRPDVLEVLDPEFMLRTMWHDHGANPNMLLSEQALQQKREQQQQQQQQMAQVAALREGAAAAKDASQAAQTLNLVGGGGG